MKRFILFLCLASFFLSSCGIDTASVPPQSTSGVSKATVKVATDLNGKTTEQNNIIARYAEDNKPGSIKHLYIISVYSGQVLIYSTVRGKVTSSGKRLSPTTVATYEGSTHISKGFDVDINGSDKETAEVLQDDGTYGSSIDYIYWFDSKGIYHQQYVTGGMLVHVSSQPIAVKSVVLNLESVDK